MIRTFGKKKKTESDGQVALQITSMADIFIIILVFLLKSFSTSSVQIAPSAGITLPDAQADTKHVEALKIEIGPGSIVVESKPIVDLKSFQFGAGELATNGTSKKLDQALKLARKRQLMIAQTNTDVKIDPKVLIIADQRTPYSTIKTTLSTAAIHGFTDFKLAVVRGE